jgi:hypothetical protein
METSAVTEWIDAWLDQAGHAALRGAVEWLAEQQLGFGLVVGCLREVVEQAG